MSTLEVDDSSKSLVESWFSPVKKMDAKKKNGKSTTKSGKKNVKQKSPDIQRNISTEFEDEVQSPLKEKKNISSFVEEKLKKKLKKLKHSKEMKEKDNQSDTSAKFKKRKISDEFCEDDDSKVAFITKKAKKNNLTTGSSLNSDKKVNRKLTKKQKKKMIVKEKVEKPNNSPLSMTSVTTKDSFWRSCAKCHKRRRLPCNFEDFPEKWFCHMNPDSRFNRCDIKAETDSESEDSDDFGPTSEELSKKRSIDRLGKSEKDEKCSLCPVNSKKRKNSDKTAEEKENNSKDVTVKKKAKKSKTTVATSGSTTEPLYNVDNLQRILQDPDSNLNKNQRKRLTQKLKKLKDDISTPVINTVSSPEKEKSIQNGTISKAKKRPSSEVLNESDGTTSPKKLKGSAVDNIPTVHTVSSLKIKLAQTDLSHTTRKRLNKRLNKLLKDGKGGSTASEKDPGSSVLSSSSVDQKNKKTKVSTIDFESSSDDDSVEHTDFKMTKLKKQALTMKSPNKLKAKSDMDQKKLMELNKAKFKQFVSKCKKDHHAASDETDSSSSTDGEDIFSCPKEIKSQGQASPKSEKKQKKKNKVAMSNSVQVNGNISAKKTSKNEKMEKKMKKGGKVSPQEGDTQASLKENDHVNTSKLEQSSKKKKTKMRSKQKNIKKDNRPEHMKPLHLQKKKTQESSE